MRVLPYILYLLLLGMYQVVLRDVTSIYNVSIDLAGAMVIIVALYKTELVATWFGFMVGVVFAAGDPLTMGWHALFLAAAGNSAFVVRNRINMDSMLAKVLVVLCGVFLHLLVCSLVDGGHRFLYLLIVEALPGAVYTTVLAWWFFLIKEERLTWKTVRELF